MTVPEHQPERPLFPNLMQLQPRVPMAVWYVLRILSVSSALATVILLFVMPSVGLKLWWGLLVPLLPLLWFSAPGLWRNVCPMATLNQLPRLFNFTRKLPQPQWLKNYSYLVGICLFLTIVPARKALFNTNGTAVALLMLSALGCAFLGGVIFRGKSGWCSSICPLLPVQRVYGQTPFVIIRNSHCEPCLGCAKNCYDFNPTAAYLADLYDADPHYAGYRKFFAAAFPGLVFGFYLLPNPPAIDLLSLYLSMAAIMVLSLGTFQLLVTFARVSANNLTALFGATALNAYYWFASPVLFGTIFGAFGLTVPSAAVWGLRAIVFSASVLWLARTYGKEEKFLEHTAVSSGVQIGSPEVLHAHRTATAGQPVLTLLPDRREILATPGTTVLEVLEKAGLHVETGCRMGMCGADPICVAEGSDQVSEAGPDERDTLRRLGLGAQTRLACCARMVGSATISLTPEPASGADGDGVAGPPVDPNIKQVVIIGNGIAGITAADHVRRMHPDCHVQVVARERHHLYNRMGITRLIYGRSAMSGLYLQPEQWYDDRRIDCWLNTRAIAIQPRERQVLLGTGEALAYDRLILAMGSAATAPPIDGFGLPGTSALREADDIMQLRAFIQEYRCREVIVSGGGLLALEGAHALLKMGLNVTVLERGPWLLRRQIDRRAADLLLQQLQALGLRILVDAELARVEGDHQVRRVQLKDGRTLDCDYVLACVGITPNVALAREAGLAIGRGILVDDHLRTSDPDIYAVGDVAEFEGEVTGLWPVAVDQARTAALNALGGDATYQPPVLPTALKVAGIDLCSLGQFEATSPDMVAIVNEGVDGSTYRKLVIDRGRVVGGILLGHAQDLPLVSAAIRDARDVSTRLESLRAGYWDALADDRQSEPVLTASAIRS